MTERLKKTIIYILILINLGLFYFSRPGIAKEYLEFEEENQQVLDKIKEYKALVEQEDLSYYTSDQEFLDEMTRLVNKNRLKDFTHSFGAVDTRDNFIESEVSLNLVGAEKEILNLLEELDGRDRLDIINIALEVLEESKIKLCINLRIRSDFTGIYRSERSLYNKKPFKYKAAIDEKELLPGGVATEEEKVISSQEDNIEDKKERAIKFKEKIVASELTAKPNLNKNKVIGVKDLGESTKEEDTKGEYKTTNMAEGLSYLEKLDVDLYLFHFKNIDPKKDRLYLTEEHLIGEEGGIALLDFSLVSNLEDLEVGLEVRDKDGNSTDLDHINFTYRGEGWKHYSDKVDMDKLVGIRLFLKPGESTGGYILTNGFSIRGLDEDEPQGGEGEFFNRTYYSSGNYGSSF